MGRRALNFRDRQIEKPPEAVKQRHGNRDGEIFAMLRGFRESWFVIEGKGGPGSAYKLKHQLWASLGELHGQGADDHRPTNVA